MENQFPIRDYRKGDFPGILSLWKATSLADEKRGDGEETIERSIALGGKLLVITNNSHQIIGTSWLTYDGRRLHLHHFGIDPSFRHKGLAKRLGIASIDYARKMKTQIKLEVHRNNHAAVQLYKNLGFEALGDYEVYIIRNTGLSSAK